MASLTPRDRNLVVLGVLALVIAGGYWYQFWSPKDLELDAVDAHVQALTRFMKQLELSPLLENVTLMSSQRANDNGKEVTQFQLDLTYTRPSATEVRRVPLAVSVR